MATYASNRDLKDVFPEVDSFDTKTPIYGWVVHSGSLYRADNCGLITLLFADGQDLGDAEANSGVVNVNGEWYYDSDIDAVYYYNSASNPNDLLMESGEDFSTLKTRFLSNASKYLDSRLDGNLPREQFKDKSGNYDYIIIRTAALIASVFLIRSQDPTNEVASAMWEEINGNIDSLNGGNTKLSWQTTGDSSKGIIREISVSGALLIVDTRGRYSGIYDRIKVKIGTGGVVGTATYNVYVGNSENLKTEQIVTNEIINGQYQSIGNGLEIRFQGSADSSTATANDEWEIEVSGRMEEIDNSSSIRSTRASRLYI
ncbi:hypothetical protein [uncultured Mediterranean phage uvDeep-CGR2-KM18-C269]|nr:hypothetical protein [uncultured Mediterranean phage uvDeep-CGR2-KM18-C269]